MSELTTPPSTRFMELLREHTALKTRMDAIEKDPDFVRVKEDLRNYFMAHNARKLDWEGVNFSWIPWKAGIKWNCTAKEFQANYPDFLAQHPDVIQPAPASGSLTIRLNFNHVLIRNALEGDLESHLTSKNTTISPTKKFWDE